MTAVIISLHILFWIFDRLPFFYLAFSIGCHLVYSLNLRTFPFISLSSLPFIASCILVFVDHFLWFRYFTTHYRPFMDIAAFFGLCVWLVPFAYFISLSANDNALPTSGDPAFVDSLPSQQKQGLMKSLLSLIGIKTQEVPSMPATSMPASSDYYPESQGTASGIHYMPPRDIQNRKTA
ncbi:transmembrane adaptor Erv26-domain-containing protein [Gilbertella persicaria]|uniref:transmembrane adaptor Erv26-domain-containing protein n=1 Tax=Gilbertella persicaria TaxID=101096 RepID=UPI00221F4263|nr:transmembrane adaptor Erv26-domain-containing protein [Gilbertella persicaria]KAI8092131.1 transmembrane adaptor Erv26-domain-containing protein [Gilbertella persicaria]